MGQQARIRILLAHFLKLILIRTAVLQFKVLQSSSRTRASKHHFDRLYLGTIPLLCERLLTSRIARSRTMPALSNTALRWYIKDLQRVSMDPAKMQASENESRMWKIKLRSKCT